VVRDDVDPGGPVMREEIFGSILPIVGVPDLDFIDHHARHVGGGRDPDTTSTSGGPADEGLALTGEVLDVAHTGGSRVQPGDLARLGP